MPRSKEQMLQSFKTEKIKVVVPVIIMAAAGTTLVLWGPGQAASDLVTDPTVVNADGTQYTTTQHMNNHYLIWGLAILAAFAALYMVYRASQAKLTAEEAKEIPALERAAELDERRSVQHLRLVAALLGVGVITAVVACAATGHLSFFASTYNPSTVVTVDPTNNTITGASQNTATDKFGVNEMILGLAIMAAIALIAYGFQWGKEEQAIEAIKAAL